MEQVKEILRQVARYRFWISVFVAALLSVGAYIVGSGPVKSQTAAEIGKIDTAAKDVQQYSSPSVPTRDFQPVVEQKTAVLVKDVNEAWEDLYKRQEPLLTWPETVSERFKKWGRSWPEDEAVGAVQLAIVDYVEAYPEYVESIYQTFHPFNYETGEGVVAAPPTNVLLRPAAFDINSPPGMGKVWSAQERLWTQRTVLEVVAQVNRDAKDWDSAYIKEIKALEVGNALSQDQRSIAKGEELVEAEDILAPGEEAAEEEMEGMEGDPSMGGMLAPGGMAGGRGRMAEMGMMGMGGMGMGGMGYTGEAESVLFLQPEEASQYKILPIMLTVLIDQNRVPNLLVELENSPMVIEVRDIEMLRPTERVVKPEKGMGFSGYGYGGMMGRGGMVGYGGMMGRMGEMDMSMMPGAGMMGPGMGGMMGPARKGVDKRGVDRAEKRKEDAKARELATKPNTDALFDPYYNIVQFTVYGQARFFNEPKPEEEEATSLGESGDEAESAAPAETGEAMPEAPANAEAEAPAEPNAEAEAPAEPNAEAPAEPNAEAPAEPKAEAEAPAEPQAPAAAEPAPQP